MALIPVAQSLGGFDPSYNPQLLHKPNTSLKERPFTRSGLAKGDVQTTFSATYFSSDTLIVNYTNKDGDSVSLSMEHIEYQKALLAVNGNASSEEWKEIVAKIKDEFLKFHENMIKKILESLNGEPVEETEDAEYKEIEGLPEYWNAENTSQRIVDFATSFYGLAESTGIEYYEMMRNAIEEGFNQAMGILGELPDAVNNLAHRTFELALQKLEAWAIEQGIDICKENEGAA